MSDFYDPSTLEAKWQKKWAEAKLYEIDLAKAKKPFYSLVMFPYPSGDKLHVGHWYNFAPADSYARFMRMQGYDVMEPMGFDAFGLPAENYAIKTGVPPAESTAKNVETMIKQLSRMGCMYDWSKTLNTSDPSYYQWTQWLFLEMYKHGIAYKKLANVNWCPKDQTVLANEQAQDGVCERCGTPVIQLPLNQWFWKITDYAQRLLDGHNNLDWPEKTILMQKHWIGRSEGAEILFDIDGHKENISVFTTRPDTLFGVTYVVLAPEHPLVDSITTADRKSAVKTYQESVKKKTELERTELNKSKTGEPTGAYAINPVNNEKIPIWIADYALINYGTGAVMAVPGHDERDYEFARKFQLPMKEVVQGGDLSKEAFTEDGKHSNSDFIDGLFTDDAKKKMIAWLEENKKGKGVIRYRLRDWLVSRQRYWGAPIPIVYDPDGNAHPVPEEHLPWLLPTDIAFKPTGESPLKESKEFKERTEKLFGKGWTPEYDTMDTFVCSSFYYLRYLSQKNEQEKSEARSTKSEKKSTNVSDFGFRISDFLDPMIEKTWMPVSMYIGGPEHACMHLIYARFVMMALKDFGYVSHDEPFKKLVHQGLITNQGAKMSKSKGNVVSPDSFIDKHGSDVFRMYLMFMGPFTDGGDWSDTGIKGVDRFAQRLYRLVKENKKIEQDSAHLLGLREKTVKKVTEDIQALRFNTAISALMEFLNAAEKEEGIAIETLRKIVTLLAPIAPHLSEELWEMLGGKGFAIEQAWPEFDASLIKETSIVIVVQVNGKLRAELTVSPDVSEKDIIAQAKSHPNVQRFLEGKEPKKAIYVKGKLVSLVL